MPTVQCHKAELEVLLGREITDAGFEDECFGTVMELDEVTSAAEMARREMGAERAQERGMELSDEIIYKVDVPANRADMLTAEGIAQALRVQRGEMAVPNYTTRLPPPSERVRILVDPSVQDVRPIVVGAVLRGVDLTQGRRFKRFVELQEKLHFNVCRRRTLASIGTHDMSKISFCTRGGAKTVHYLAQAPEDIKFVALKTGKNKDKPSADEVRDGRQLFEYLQDPQNDTAVAKYCPLIEHLPKWPVFRDGKGQVLSLPPIINSEYSKMSEQTRDIFIEVTAVDKTKAKVALNTLVCLFSQYSSTPFEVEAVEVQQANGEVTTTPDLSPLPLSTSASYVSNGIGRNVELSPSKVASMLTAMQLPATARGDSIEVQVPPTRTDILHEVDLLEDVAVAFGYNNVPRTLPPTRTQVATDLTG
ncbi:MAG: hypothetical protein MHM6MM_003458 [Cercozoa sp. M6MM]